MALEYSNVIQATGTFLPGSDPPGIAVVNAAGFDRARIIYVGVGSYVIGLEQAAAQSECVLIPAVNQTTPGLSITAATGADNKSKQVHISNNAGDPVDAAFSLTVLKLPVSAG